MIKLLSLVLLGQLADGGTAPSLTIDSLYVDCPSADVPPAEKVDGGYFLPELRARRQVCMQAALENYATPKLAEESAKPMPPGAVLGIIGGATGLVIVGFIVGFFFPHSLPPVK